MLLIILLLYSYSPAKNDIFLHDVDKCGHMIEKENFIPSSGEHLPKAEKNGVQITIDKEDDEMQRNEMNYHQWIRILGEVARLINKIELNDAATAEIQWSETDKTYSFANNTSDILKINVILKESNKHLVTYTIIPWQNFARNLYIDEKISIQPEIFDNLLTVIDYAVIYTSYSQDNLTVTESNYLERFNTAFKKVIDYDNNQASVDDDVLDIPDGIRIISSSIFKHYIDLQIAIPGSSLPEFSRWATVSKSKMLHLNLIPDVGQVRSSWIKPADLSISVNYTSVEEELQDLFAKAVDKSLEQPNNREEILSETKERLKTLFGAADGEVNFLYDKYEARLNRWLLHSPAETDYEDIFSDYEPKVTPDTMLDFMLKLGEDYYKIPDARLQNLVELINLLNIHQEKAKKNPGHWVDGNILLGAKPREYQPTRDELLASETGDRINEIINQEPKKQIRSLLQKEKLKLKQLEYTRFSFTHVDVMGSGRFFYVETIEKIVLSLP